MTTEPSSNRSIGIGDEGVEAGVVAGHVLDAVGATLVVVEVGQQVGPHRGPGAGRRFGGDGGGGFFARHARLRRDLEAGQNVGVLGRVIRLPVGLAVLLDAGAVAAGCCWLCSWSCLLVGVALRIPPCASALHTISSIHVFLLALYKHLLDGRSRSGMRNVTLRQLRMFDAVARRLSYTRGRQGAAPDAAGGVDAGAPARGGSRACRSSSRWAGASPHRRRAASCCVRARGIAALLREAEDALKALQGRRRRRAFDLP